MIDSNVALPRRSEIAADDYHSLSCCCEPFLRAWYVDLSQRGKIVRRGLIDWSLFRQQGTRCLRFFANAFAYITEICG